MAAPGAAPSASYTTPRGTTYAAAPEKPQRDVGPADLIPVTNLLERLFVEERRRLKIIPNGFGEKAVLKLMFGALIRAAERWRGLRFTEFETRQLAAVRNDLDEEYTAAITPKARTPQPSFSSRSQP